MSCEATGQRESVVFWEWQADSHRLSVPSGESIPGGRCASHWQKFTLQKESAGHRVAPLKRKVQQEDIIKDVKRHSYYVKPGEKKRLKQALARKRLRKRSRMPRD